MSAPGCRSCGTQLGTVFADLGMAPLANAFLGPADLNRMEPFYPLKAYVCGACFLVQLEQYATPERIFGDYAYFSSYSDTWVEHCRRFADDAIRRYRLGPESSVIEVASNDGCLLQHFKRAGMQVLGIEPAANVAKAAEARGIRTLVEFLGQSSACAMAGRGIRADLLVANNVLAHVPDLNDFIAGLALLLRPEGVLTMEFPHLHRLIEGGQFDTIYHEHFSYFSLRAAACVLGRHGLEVFDAEEIPTHGGSLRVHAAHSVAARTRVTAAPAGIVAREAAAGLDRLATYAAFEGGMRAAKRALLGFLIDVLDRGQSVVGYGAPAKGNTLLNYCGIRRDLLDYTVDRNPHKQGRYLPGTHIPIQAPERIAETKPDFVLVLPWNIRDEVVHQMGHIREWGGRFVVPIPRPEVLP